MKWWLLALPHVARRCGLSRRSPLDGGLVATFCGLRAPSSLSVRLSLDSRVAHDRAHASMVIRSRNRIEVFGLLPGLDLLRRYESGWLRPDLLAGLTVGAMVVPQSMAYAELAGLPPQFGFYSVIGALLVYALVGSSRHLGVGPEPGTAILAATGVASIAGGDPGRYVALMPALALIVAVVCLVGAALRLGFLASLLSKPVLVGYISGVGLTLVTSQVGGLTGASISSDTPLSRVRELSSSLGDVHGLTLLLGVSVLAAIFGLKRLAPTVPGALIAIIIGSAVTALLGLEDHGIALVGDIPGGLPTPQLPDVSVADFGRLLPVAAGIALVGYTDNVLTARSIAASKGYRIDDNRELAALGLINLTSGLSQGFPVSSSASRTAVPASLGSRTQVVSLVACALVVASLLGLRPLLANIPKSALAAVIVFAAISIVDVKGLRSLWRIDRAEAALAAVTAMGVIVFGVLVGVLVAVGLSVLAALSRMARPHDAVLGDSPDVDGWVAVDDYPEARVEPGLVVYRFDAPLFFLNARRYQERVEQVLLDNPGEEDWVVLDFEGIGALDATAVESIEDLLRRLVELEVAVTAVARANHEVIEQLARAELTEPIGPLRCFPTINAAVRAYRRRDEAGPLA